MSSSRRTPGPGQAGPMILDSSGGLVWFKALPAHTSAANFQVQEYEGKPVLTWWQGDISVHGFGLGEDVIADASYTDIAHVKAGNGYQADLHDFQLTPQGTALITAYDPILCNLSSVGGRADGAVTDGDLPGDRRQDRTGHATNGRASTTSGWVSHTYMPANRRRARRLTSSTSTRSTSSGTAACWSPRETPGRPTTSTATAARSSGAWAASTAASRWGPGRARPGSTTRASSRTDRSASSTTAHHRPCVANRAGSSSA